MSTKKKPFDLSGHTGVVTGASRGIGQAIAVGLAEAGAGIVAIARSQPGLEMTKAAVEAAGANCTCIQADISSVDQINRAFADIESAHSLPDILINNAGMEEVCPSVDVDEALWSRIVDTNLKGAFFVAQSFAKPLLATKKRGSIVNLGSLTAAVGVASATPYTSSKSGVLGMTRALSTEWSPAGIRVNAIGPGYFRTELTGSFYEDESWQERMLTRIPMGRFGQLDDLKGVAVFLASEASAYVTGQIFYVDGGYLASI